jgi:hypothetical protein
MPSFEHEAIVELIRDHPSLLAGMLASTGMAADRLVPDDATVSEVVPNEYHADLLLVGVDAVVIVEVQLRVDHDKEHSSPGYVVSARRRHRLPTWLVVVTPSGAVAKWASRGICEGSLRILPLVMGPEANPGGETGAILALFLHRGVARERAIAALIAAGAMDGERGDRYVHVVLEYIRGHDPALAEELMTDKAFVWPRNPWLEQHDRVIRAEGEARGLASSVLTILAARGLSVSDEARARIASADVETLRGWLERIVSAPSTEALLESS